MQSSRKIEKQQLSTHSVAVSNYSITALNGFVDVPQQPNTPVISLYTQETEQAGGRKVILYLTRGK